MSDPQSLEDSVLETIPDEILGVKISIEEIRSMITELATLPQENMKDAMHKLKKALLANPDACNLLLPEEIGACVAGLYKSANQKIQQESAKSLVKAGKKAISGKVDLSKIDIGKLEDF